MPNIEQKLYEIQSLLDTFPQTPRLLAVSKKKPAELIEIAYTSGQYAFGESYLQEACKKIVELKHLSNLEWHFIGPIQSNKCKQIAMNFDWVQSLDRLKVAARLNEHCPEGKTLQVCVQINIDTEKQKAGLQPEALSDFCERLSTFPKIQLRGLMAIPKAGKSISEQHTSFARIAECYTRLQQQFPDKTIDTLSMGMSNDYAIALEHGATLIRLGSTIFGERE